MTEVLPTAGSVYGFARHSLGSFPGFIAGWMILLDYSADPGLRVRADGRRARDVAAGNRPRCLDRAAGGRHDRRQLVRHHLDLAGQLRRGGAAGHRSARLHGVGRGRALCRQGQRRADPQALVRRGDLQRRQDFQRDLDLRHVVPGFDAVSTLAEEVKGGDRRVVGRAIIAVLVLSAVFFVDRHLGPRQSPARHRHQGSGGGDLRTRRVGYRTLDGGAARPGPTPSWSVCRTHCRCRSGWRGWSSPWAATGSCRAHSPALHPRYQHALRGDAGYRGDLARRGARDEKPAGRSRVDRELRGAQRVSAAACLGAAPLRHASSARGVSSRTGSCRSAESSWCSPCSPA